MTTNYITALSTWFTDPAACNLHLASSVASVVNAGTTISGLTIDIDGDLRPIGAAYDLGADEYTGSSSSSGSSGSGGGGSVGLWFLATLVSLVVYAD